MRSDRVFPDPGARAAPALGDPPPGLPAGPTTRFHEGPSLATAACRGTRLPGKGRDAFPGSFPGGCAGRPRNNPENHRPRGRPSHSPLAARGTRAALRWRCGRSAAIEASVDRGRADRARRRGRRRNPCRGEGQPPTTRRRCGSSAATAEARSLPRTARCGARAPAARRSATGGAEPAAGTWRGRACTPWRATGGSCARRARRS